MTTENPGQRDHLHAGKPAPDLDDRLDAFSPRHRQIGHHEIDLLRRKHVERLIAVPGMQNLEPVRSETCLEGVAHERFVIDEQDPVLFLKH